MADTSPLPSWIRTLDQIISWIALIGGGLTLAFMMGLSAFNVVVMRKALNAPITGVEDLMILSLVILVAFAIPFGGRTGAHIEIEVLEARMSPKFAKSSMTSLRFVAAALMSTMTYQLIHAGMSATKFGETTQQLLISYEPFYYLLACSTGLYAVVLVSDVLQLTLRGKVDVIDLGEAE